MEGISWRPHLIKGKQYSFPEHGTTARYKHRLDPCRCELCKKAYREYMKNYRKDGPKVRGKYSA
jgi:hypothetical protein